MIRINLLRQGPAPERARLATPSSLVPLACAAILLASTGGIAWWAWSLSAEETRLAGELASARQEAERLRGVIAEVTRYEARQQQLRERVSLIEQLRRNQAVPVRLVDAVSRSLPEMLWLTTMKQAAGELTIEGRSTTLLALSDLVANLAGSGIFERPIELVDSRVESAGGGTGPVTELIHFTVKARVAGSEPAPVPTPATARPAGGRR